MSTVALIHINLTKSGFVFAKGDVYAMFLADAAYLYFTLLNETLAEGGDYRDGEMMLQKAKGRKFDGT